MNTAFRVALFICLALALAGCGRAATYRYKLTLTLDTPDGVKTGFNVVKVNYFEVRVPASGTPHKVSGQGIYIDLGPGRRPLIALLTSADWRQRQPPDLGWGEDAPTWIFSRACLGSKKVLDVIAEVSAIAASCKAPFEISKYDLPDLVTFADPAAPATVRKVDPDHLSSELGPGIFWRSITLQATDEPLTEGLEKYLPWIPEIHGTMLDGDRLQKLGPSATLANSLSTADFRRR